MLKAKAPKITTPDLAALSLAGVLARDEGVIQASEAFLKSEPLNQIGALDHVGQRHFFSWFVPSSLWADSIVMYVLNGYKMAKLKGDLARQQFFIDQALLFQQYLRDPVTGLYKHAYYVKSKTTVPQEHFWARGNLWISLALVDMLEDAPHENLHKMLVDHMEALAKYADIENGLRTLLDDPSADFETSATALFAYTLRKGIRLGLVSKTHRPLSEAMTKAVWRKLVKVKEGELSLTGISGPTTALKWPFYYKHLVGQQADTSYGVGAFLLLCSELP